MIMGTRKRSKNYIGLWSETMELSRDDTKRTKGFAVLLMVFLHLFQRLDYEGLFSPLLYVAGKPLVFYIALLADCCVAIFCFCSGYAQYVQYEKAPHGLYKSTLIRTGGVLLNYWIVVILSACCGLLFGVADVIPGSVSEFLSNFFLISKSYNGAWWFMFTYILLMLLSPLTNWITKHTPAWLLTAASCICFVAAHFGVENSEWYAASSLQWFITQALLLLRSLFPYFCGCIFAKKRLYSKIKNYLSRYNRHAVNLMALVTILVLLVFHAFIRTSAVAPFTGVILIVAFNLISFGKVGKATFGFFGKHATNIWLTHMFFYVDRLGALVYKAKYPLLIFLLMLALTVLASYCINFIYHPVLKIYNCLLRRERRTA